MMWGGIGPGIQGGRHPSHPDERSRHGALFQGSAEKAFLSFLRLFVCRYCLPGLVLPSRSVDPIDEAWARVEADWGNEEAHRRFVGACVALDRLPEAGKRYREVRENDPARREDAAKQIDKLIGLATQQLQDTRLKPATTEHKRTLTWAAFFIMLVLMGAGVLLLMRG